MAASISVVMPVYNASRYLAEAVESILAQTYRDYEFVCVDDGSKDDSFSILREYEQKDSRIRLISRPNTGIVGALNDGLAVAVGEFVARMDADDAALPRRFEVQVAYLREHPECVAVGGQVLKVDPDGWPLMDYHAPLSHEEIDAVHLNIGLGTIIHPTSMIRRMALTRVGGYRNEFPWAEDLDLWLRLAEIGRLANLPDLVLRYRVHLSSICVIHNEVQKQSSNATVADARRRRGLPPLEQCLHADHVMPSEVERRRRWVMRALDAGFFPTARKHAWRVLKEQPFARESWTCWVRAMLQWPRRETPAF